MSAFSDLEVMTVEAAYNRPKMIILPALRNFSRQVLIISASNQVLFNQEYPFYPMSGGPYSGYPAWRAHIIDIIKNEIPADKNPKAVYFCGLTTEYSQLRYGIQDLKEENILSSEFECHFKRPNLTGYRKNMALKQASNGLRKLEAIYNKKSK